MKDRADKKKKRIEILINKYRKGIKEKHIKCKQKKYNEQTKTIGLLSYYNNQFFDYMSRRNRQYRHCIYKSLIYKVVIVCKQKAHLEKVG